MLAIQELNMVQAFLLPPLRNPCLYSSTHAVIRYESIEDILTSFPQRKNWVSVCVRSAGECRDTPLMSVEWPKEKSLPRVLCRVVCALVLKMIN